MTKASDIGVVGGCSLSPTHKCGTL